jgi:aryl-alcohol dehydrogenase
MSTLQAGRTVRGAIQGDSRPDLFIPYLVDLFVAGRFPIDRLVTFYDFASINQADADAVNGTTIKPVLRMPQRPLTMEDEEWRPNPTSSPWRSTTTIPR